MTARKKNPEPPAEPPAALTAKPVSAGEFRMLAIDRIVASPHNPRKSFPAESLGALASSIAEKGVLEPILVRPRLLWHQVCAFVASQRRRMEADQGDYGLHRDQFQRIGDITLDAQQYDVAIDSLLAESRIARSPMLNASYQPTAGALAPVTSTGPYGSEPTFYEIVAGERRWRASQQAGLAEIPAIVRTLDDLAAAEIAVIENDQREDVAPLEQAEGYARLVALGEDPEAIAIKIGRPLKYVVGRLQLLQLDDELKGDMRSGQLPFGHAWLLSRLPAAAQMEIRGKLYERWGDEKGQACSIAQLKRMIRQGNLWPLASVPWKLDHADLVPAAGACTTCPKRSGNNPPLFDELLDEGRKASEYCLDGDCYRAKREAFVELQVRNSTKKHGAEPVRITTDFWADKGSDVVPASHYQIVTAKEAKEMPAGTVKPAVIVAGDGDKVGKAVLVKLVKASTRDNAFTREQAKAKEKKRLQQLAASVACQRVYDHAVAACGSQGVPKPMRELLRVMTWAMVDAGWSEASRVLCRRRGLKGSKELPYRNLVENIAAAANGAELFGLCAELLAARKSLFEFEYETRENTQFWSAFGVVPKEIIKQVAGEAKQAKQAKKKATGKKAAAADTTEESEEEPEPAPDEADTPEPPQAFDPNSVRFPAVGDCVRTSYGTGPYRITSISSQKRGTETFYSFVVAHPVDGNPAYLNDFRWIDGAMHCSREGKTETDELFVIPAGTDPGPTYHDWCRTHHVADQHLKDSLKYTWMLGRTPRPAATDEPEPGPMVCKPLGELPLAEIPGITPQDVTLLKAVGLVTLGSLEVRINDRLDDQSAADPASRIISLLGLYRGIFTPGDVERIAGAIAAMLTLSTPPAAEQPKPPPSPKRKAKVKA